MSNSCRGFSPIPDSTYDKARSLEQRLHSGSTQSSLFSNTSLSTIVLPQVDAPTLQLPQEEQHEATNISNGLPPVISEEILQNHQKSFHYAVLLFFYRVCSSIPQSPKAAALLPAANGNHDCQAYVGIILDCLENIEALTRDLPIRPANTLWPAFIAAVEAVNVDLRQRALIWLTKAAQRGLGNVSRAKEIVMETWRRVDRYWNNITGSQTLVERRGLGRVDWRRVMEDTGSYPMLT